MNPIYQAPSELQATRIHGRHLVSTLEGGKISLDSTLFLLWGKAKGRALSEILKDFPSEGSYQETVKASLACLAQAGLLSRTLPQDSTDKNSHPSIRIGDTALVSAIIVGYNGQEWLKDCLPSLLDQTYPHLEVILIDNASTDGTQEWVAEHFPPVVCSHLNESVSLADAINCGVSLATGEYYLILNQDVRLEPDALANMIEVIKEEPSCAAIAPKLKFSWASAFLNGIGNQVSSFSWGADLGLGHIDFGQFDSWHQVPSACFAAALIRRTAWDEIGPIDAGFALYYEDVEWCYRARLLGYTVLAAPQAIIYHAYSGRIPSGDETSLSDAKLRNVVYGRLRFAFRLLSGSFLFRFFCSYLLEDGARIALAFIRFRWNTIRAYFQAWNKFLHDIPSIRHQRQAFQLQKKRTDKELFALQRQFPPPLIWRGLPELSWDIIRHHYQPYLMTHMTESVPEFSSQHIRPHLLIVSKDVVDTKMGGTGMRNLEIARALSNDLEVTLAHPSSTNLQVPKVLLVEYTENQPETLRKLVETADVTLISGDSLERFPFLYSRNTRLVVDLYAPFMLENLHYYLDESFLIQESFSRPPVEITNRLVRSGDFFICGSERQRDFWIGVLTANGRVNPRNYAKDPSLRALIDVVTVGFPDRQPRQRPILRGINPSIPANARIVLWGGGIWEWLDPLTLVKAWPGVLQQHPSARLVFLGTRHPNPQIPEHKMATKTQELAEKLGEKDQTIIFFDWTPYEDREAFLCEADVGVALHPPHIETRFSIRTRVLDYLWTNLPVLVSDGDVTSEWVRQFDLGRVVPPLDAEAVTKALCEILDKPKNVWAEAFEPLHEMFSWSQVVEPLRRYCLEGDFAPDRENQTSPLSSNTQLGSFRGQISRAYYIWRNEGFRTFLHRAWRYIQWYLSHP